MTGGCLALVVVFALSPYARMLPCKCLEVHSLRKRPDFDFEFVLEFWRVETKCHIQRFDLKISLNNTLQRMPFKLFCCHFSASREVQKDRISECHQNGAEDIASDKDFGKSIKVNVNFKRCNEIRGRCE